MKIYGILFSIICCGQIAFAQVRGNGKLIEFTKPFESMRSLDIQFNADILIDYNADEILTIKIDENIKDLVGMEFRNGKLTLDQVQWIEPSTQPQITIGVNKLKRIFQGAHSSTHIINVDNKELRLEGNVGKITVAGKTENLNVYVSGTDLLLKKLEIGLADIRVVGNSKIFLGKVKRIETKFAEDDRIILSEEPDEYITTVPLESQTARSSYDINPELRYIEFKIRNTRLTRKHFVVVGPKKDGTTFSYGFSMFPKTNRSEKWSIGTLIYEEKRNGKRELLVEITDEDENTTVDLFRG